jgi:glutamate formiminotransferase
LKQAYDAVRKEAERVGVKIAGTEIVGLVPEAALDTRAEYFAQLENFGADAVIEHRIRARESGRRAKD